MLPGMAYCTQQTAGLTRGVTLRAIQAAGADAVVEPDWMVPFLASLARDDLSPATLRGYRYDLRHFLAWHRKVQDGPEGPSQIIVDTSAFQHSGLSDCLFIMDWSALPFDGGNLRLSILCE